MRSLRSLALALTALTPLACGGAEVTSGNVFVTESALGTFEGATENTGRLVLVSGTIDPSDPGCTVDGVRAEACTFTTSSSIDYDGPLNLCELDVHGGSTYVWQCDLDAHPNISAAELEELPQHCP